MNLIEWILETFGVRKKTRREHDPLFNPAQLQENIKMRQWENLIKKLNDRNMKEKA